MVRESKNKQIERLITPRLTAEHIELLEVEYRKENGEQILRLFIDSEKGVDLNVCSRATRAVKDIIDENSIDYDHLEVSSPGINRILKNDSHLVKHNQARVQVKTVRPVNGHKKLVGILLGHSQDHIELQIEDQVVQIPRENISIIRLHPDI